MSNRRSRSASRKRSVKKRRSASVDFTPNFGVESQQTLPHRSKQDVVNDYSKILNSTFPSDSSMPTISDVSKNFLLKPIDGSGTIFLVTRKHSSTTKRGKSPVATPSAKPKSTRRAIKKSPSAKRRKTVPRQRRFSSILSRYPRPVRINGRLALEAPPTPSRKSGRLRVSDTFV